MRRVGIRVLDSRQGGKRGGGGRRRGEGNDVQLGFLFNSLASLFFYWILDFLPPRTFDNRRGELLLMYLLHVEYLSHRVLTLHAAALLLLIIINNHTRVSPFAIHLILIFQPSQNRVGSDWTRQHSFLFFLPFGTSSVPFSWNFSSKRHSRKS